MMDSVRVHTFAYRSITSHFFHRKIFYMDKKYTPQPCLQLEVPLRLSQETWDVHTSEGGNLEAISNLRASSSS